MPQLYTPRITAFFDGACGPTNPGGIAAWGALVYKDGELIWEANEVHKPEIEGQTSNNLAEYCGCHAALTFIIDKGYDDLPCIIFGDSKLVIEQMSGRWKLKGGLYFDIAKETKKLINQFGLPPLFRWIPREQNVMADHLSKVALHRGYTTAS